MSYNGLSAYENLADLYSRLAWRYKRDPFDHMRSPAWVADLTAWHRLGRGKLPLDTGPDAA